MLFRTLYTLHLTPFFVSVEPAAVCQLHCPACPVGINQKSKIQNQKSQLMSRPVWERTLAEVSRTARIIQFYFQGEPLLHKDLHTMIAEAHQAGLYTIVSTNAQAMTPELAEALVQSGLNRIIISMDGLTEESYGAYRIGGSLDKTKAALQWLRESKIKNPKSKILIELQCLRLKSNEHEWSEFKRVYKSLGADRLTFKTAQLYDYADGHPLMPSDSRYSRYTQGPDGHYHRKRRWPWCTRVLTGCVITTTGDVLPCCYDKAHEHVFGNIMDAPLADILRSDKARAFIRAAQHEQPAICKECWR
jgi:radical SAM protein with 4Fe4S-binding SPASM domain